MVRLRPAGGEERVAALLEGLADEELQLADLVAGGDGAGEVVALDVERHAEVRAEALELLERGRGARELQPLRVPDLAIRAPPRKLP